MKNKKIYQSSLSQFKLKEEKLEYLENKAEWKKIKFEKEGKNLKKEKSNSNHYRDFDELICKECISDTKEQKA